MVRIDIPTGPDEAMTQLYNVKSIYCLTPSSEEAARSVAQMNRPQPVHHFELPHHGDLP